MSMSAANADVKETQKELLKGSAVTFFEIDDEELESNTTQEYEEIAEEMNLEMESEEHANYTLGNQERIIGDTAPITDAPLFPFMAYLTSTTPTGTLRRCTGVLITTEYILTAASCVYGSNSILVSLGDVVAPEPALVATAVVHPKFTNKDSSGSSTGYSSNYDIALVKLELVTDLSTAINIINIASKEQAYDSKDLAGKTVFMLGFGDVAQPGVPAALHSTSMRVMSSLECYRATRNNLYRAGIHQSCLDTRSGSLGMCTQGDIGAPVLYRFGTDNSYTLVGIANYFHSCKSSTPNMFTRIGPFLDIIRKTLPDYLPY